MTDTMKEIASRVRELRECCEVDAAEIAELINLPLAEYSRMENGEVDFPASSLYEIANKLNADFTELLTGRPAHVGLFSVTRKGGGVVVNRSNQYAYENLAANFLHKKCEPFIVTVPVSEQDAELNSHFGQEFIFMLEGEMLVKIQNNEIVLKTGDTLYFDSTNAHSMKTLGVIPAKFIDVIL